VIVISRQRRSNALETLKTGHINHMKKLILSLLFIACVFSSRGYATSLVTLENVAISNIGNAMGTYQILNNGQIPTTWAQIGEGFDLEKINKGLASRQSSVPQPTFIQDRYQFVTQPLPTLDGRAQVLIMRTVPLVHLEDLKGEQTPIEKQWRYVVLQGKDSGTISGTRLPEKEIQAMLKKAGMTITPKLGLAAVETDDRIPGTEPKPQPNPADAAILAQYPELDPTKPASSSAPESAAVTALRALIEWHPKVRNGQPLTSWDQAKKIYNVEALNRSLAGLPVYPLEDHYQFITQPLPLRGEEGSQVLLIRTVPLEKNDPDSRKSRQYRYLVYRNSEGKILSIRMPEETVQEMLKKAGVTITPKPGLPATETEDRIPETEQMFPRAKQ